MTFWAPPMARVSRHRGLDQRRQVQQIAGLFVLRTAINDLERGGLRLFRCDFIAIDRSRDTREYLMRDAAGFSLRGQSPQRTLNGLHVDNFCMSKGAYQNAQYLDECQVGFPKAAVHD